MILAISSLSFNRYLYQYFYLYVLITNVIIYLYINIFIVVIVIIIIIINFPLIAFGKCRHKSQNDVMYIILNQYNVASGSIASRTFSKQELNIRVPHLLLCAVLQEIFITMIRTTETNFNHLLFFLSFVTFALLRYFTCLFRLQ